MDKEVRAFNIDTKSLEIRDNEEEECKIRGYAAVFDKLSEELGFFKEKIEKGAFNRTIIEDDIRALWNHDDNYVLGRNTNGTLKLEEDDHGLRIEVTPPDTQWAKDFMESMRRGDVSQMSFGFFVRKDEWDDENAIRTLKDIELLEVSPVTFPAYPQTSVTARSLEHLGINFDQLSGALTRAKKGNKTQNDEKIIRTAIKALENLIDTRKDGDDDVKAELENLKERIKLLEKQSE